MRPSTQHTVAIDSMRLLHARSLCAEYHPSASSIAAILPTRRAHGLPYCVACATQPISKPTTPAKSFRSSRKDIYIAPTPLRRCSPKFSSRAPTPPATPANSATSSQGQAPDTAPVRQYASANHLISHGLSRTLNHSYLHSLAARPAP